MNLTPKQHSQLIEDTITEIREKGINDARISLTCVKRKINEATIRKIAMWVKED